MELREFLKFHVFFSHKHF